MTKSIKNVADVAQWRLCLGCGACAYHCPQQSIRLVDDINQGIRPRIEAPVDCGSCSACLDVCPAFKSDYSSHNARSGILPELVAKFGPVIEIWEGHAVDDEIRYSGSSGGALTAIGLYSLEKLGMYGVLHIGGDPSNLPRNRTWMSQNRSDLLERTGSRYAPASACDRLKSIEDSPAPCVFIGQPAEVTALRKAQLLHPALDQRIGLALSFFCAGSPSTQGTLELLKRLGVDAGDLEQLRYRGNGWPGNFAPTLKGQSSPAKQVSYADSWGFLQRFRPYAIHLWPDDTGESADISCGDPWYRKLEPGESGSSLIVVRTELGRQVIKGAIEAGYLRLTPAEPWKLLKSQENLTRKRRSIWGRRLVFKAFGLPVTDFKGLPLFRLWLGLSLKEKLKSTLGTAHRVVRRRFQRPLPIPGEAETPHTRQHSQ